MRIREHIATRKVVGRMHLTGANGRGVLLDEARVGDAIAEGLPKLESGLVIIHIPLPADGAGQIDSRFYSLPHRKQRKCRQLSCA